MSEGWSRDLSLPELRRLASLLGLGLRVGDVVTLSGPVGAGKTTFARALIASLGAAEEVPSPTFALVESYDGGRTPLHHFDLYRVRDASEIEELGLDDALRTGVAIIEWPERAAGVVPADRLEIMLDETNDADRRGVSLKGLGAYATRAGRLAGLFDFLQASDWREASVAFLQGDASTRAYARLTAGHGRAVLMDAPRQPDGPPIRDGKPYSAIAHLAEDIRSFVGVAEALRPSGVSAPAIYAHDLDRGFVVIEDFGDRLFAREAALGKPIQALYRGAVDALVALSGVRPPDRLPLPDGTAVALPAYDLAALEIEVALLVDWLWPALHGAPAPAAMREEFVTLWRPHLEQAAGSREGWVLRDYHSPNLLWLPEREGVARVGVIDFQDAMLGPLAYDLVSLLQDARVDIPEALEADLLAHYCRERGSRDGSFSSEQFEASYAVLGAQRNTKILGIFARLARRDGKRAYIAHMPRVARYLARDLAHPSLAALAAWYRRHLPTPDRYTALAI